MTATPAPELSAQEREIVERFEAAADAPESLRERMAVAIYETDFPDRQWQDCWFPERWRSLADAAIAVMRGTR